MVSGPDGNERGGVDNKDNGGDGGDGDEDVVVEFDGSRHRSRPPHGQSSSTE